MAAKAKKVSGKGNVSKSTSTKTNKKENTMKTAVKKTTGKKSVKKATNKKTAARKTKVVQQPDYKFTPFVLPAEVDKIEERLVGLSSMEHATQIAISLGYPEELVHRLFVLRFEGTGKDETWIKKRSHKYFIQETHHMQSGRLVKMLHNQYQATITRRASAKKSAAARKAKKASKKKSA